MSEEEGRPISTIFMLHEGVSQLITMVTFFAQCLYCFGEQATPQKYAQWRYKSCDFGSTLAVCISEVIQVTDLISHQHHSFMLHEGLSQLITMKAFCGRNIEFAYIHVMLYA